MKLQDQAIDPTTCDHQWFLHELMHESRYGDWYKCIWCAERTFTTGVELGRAKV